VWRKRQSRKQAIQELSATAALRQLEKIQTEQQRIQQEQLVAQQALEEQQRVEAARVLAAEQQRLLAEQQAEAERVLAEEQRQLELQQQQREAAEREAALKAAAIEQQRRQEELELLEQMQAAERERERLLLEEEERQALAREQERKAQALAERRAKQAELQRRIRIQMENNAAVVIQKHVRGHQARLTYQVGGLKGRAVSLLLFKWRFDLMQSELLVLSESMHVRLVVDYCANPLHLTLQLVLLVDRSSSRRNLIVSLRLLPRQQRRLSACG